MQAILPLVKKYGAAVVALTLDESGIPLLAEQRFAVAEKSSAALSSTAFQKKISLWTALP